MTFYTLDTSRSSGIWLAIIMLWTSVSLPQDKQVAADCKPKPFSLDSVLKQGAFARGSTYAVSPDGAWVAYVISHHPLNPITKQDYLSSGLPSRFAGTQIAISPITAQGKRDLCPEKVSCIAPSWSPDGKRVAYYSDAGGHLGLWVADVESLESRKLVEQNIKVSRMAGEEPQWSPDGRYLYVSSRPADQLQRLTVRDASNINTLHQAENQGSILRVDTHSGRTTELTSYDKTAALFRVSPDGKYITYLTTPRENEAGLLETQLAVLSIQEAKTSILAPKISTTIQNYDHGIFAWHPTEPKVAFLNSGKVFVAEIGAADKPTVTSIHPELVMQDGLLLFSKAGDAIIGMDTTSPTGPNLVSVPLKSANKIKRFGLAEGAIVSQILPASENAAWGSEKYSLAVLAQIEGKTALIGLNKNAQGEIIHEGGDYEFSPKMITRQGPAILFEDFNTPKEIFAFNSDLERRGKISHLHGKFAGTFSSSRQILARTAKFERTALILPENLATGFKPPTVIVGYPGAPTSRRADHFNGGTLAGMIPAEALLRRGYAVALVDLPIGPPGKPGEPLKELAEVLGPQIDRLANSGLVDADRFALLGISHGGYFAAGTPAALPARYRDKIKASVAVSGIYDFVNNFKKNPSEFISGQLRMGVALDEDPDRYRRNSPLYRVNEITTPILFVHGTGDDTFSDAEEMVRALKALGRDAVLEQFKDEGHVPSEWTLENHKKAIEKSLDFLSTHLGPGACFTKATEGAISDKVTDGHH